MTGEQLIEKMFNEFMADAGIVADVETRKQMLFVFRTGAAFMYREFAFRGAPTDEAIERFKERINLIERELYDYAQTTLVQLASKPLN